VTPVQRINLTLRVGLETGVVAALTYWGYRTGGDTTSRTLLAIAAPAIAFGTWGTLDFRFAGRFAEPLRLVEELAITALAAVALYLANQPTLGIALAMLSAIYHVLVYATVQRLLKPPSQATA
jgi:hypothetical protein